MKRLNPFVFCVLTFLTAPVSLSQKNIEQSLKEDFTHIKFDSLGLSESTTFQEDTNTLVALSNEFFDKYISNRVRNKSYVL